MTRPMFRIWQSPNRGGRLTHLLELPVANEPPLLLACATDWPFGKDAYCHPISTRPDESELVDEVPVERCWRTGKAVYLVLGRRQRRRSMFVWTKSRGREVIFWRTQATMAAARPGLKVPQARGLDRSLEIAVDLRERHPWQFAKQRARCVQRELPVGDYGVFSGDILCGVVERKNAGNLAGDAVSGRLGFALAELAQIPYACLVVEGRLSDVLKAPKGHVKPDWLMSVVAALQVQHPSVAWTYADTRNLAQDYAFRWLAAAVKRYESIAQTAAEAAGTYLTDEERFQQSIDATPPEAYQQPLMVRDRSARLTEAMAIARRGRTWRSTEYADHFSVSRPTALKDLNSLVEAGSLVAEGSRRTRSFRLAEK